MRKSRFSEEQIHSAIRQADEMRFRIEALEDENATLKQVLAEKVLEIELLKSRSRQS